MNTLIHNNTESNKLNSFTEVRVVGSRWLFVTAAHNCIFHLQHADRKSSKSINLDYSRKRMQELKN